MLVLKSYRYNIIIKLIVQSGELRTKGFFEISIRRLFIYKLKLAGRAPASTIHYPLYTIH